MTFLSRRLVIRDAPDLSHIGAIARRRWWLYASVAAAAGLSVFLLIGKLRTPHPPPEAVGGTVSVEGAPVGAVVTVDGRPGGQLPLAVHLRAGAHRVEIGGPGFLSETHIVDVALGSTETIRTDLWLERPRASELMPPLPGATLAGADFLRDGRVALIVAIPPGDERQVWLDGPGSEQRRLGPPLARGSAAVSPDGARVAYLASPASSLGAGQPPNELWLAAGDGQGGARRFAVAEQNVISGQLVDVTWAPDGRHLLLVAKQAAPAGGQRSTISWLEANQGDPRPLVSLPDDVVPGSYSWSPDGARVAFLATGSGRTSLCLQAVPQGDFRYLGDVNTGGLSHPLPVSPVSWRADGSELIYSAAPSRQAGVGGWLFAGGSSAALYTVSPTAPTPRIVNGGQGQAPTWLPDGSLLSLARGKAGGPLLLRHMSSGAPPVDGPALPVTSGPTPSDGSHAHRRRTPPDRRHR